MVERGWNSTLFRGKTRIFQKRRNSCCLGEDDWRCNPTIINQICFTLREFGEMDFSAAFLQVDPAAGVKLKWFELSYHYMNQEYVVVVVVLRRKPVNQIQACKFRGPTTNNSPSDATPETPTQQRSRHHSLQYVPQKHPMDFVAHATKQWDPPCQLQERHQQHSGRWWRTRKTTHPHGPLTSDLISIAGKAEKIMRTYHQKSFKSAVVLWVF